MYMRRFRWVAAERRCRKEVQDERSARESLLTRMLLGEGFRTVEVELDLVTERARPPYHSVEGFGNLDEHRGECSGRIKKRERERTTTHLRTQTVIEKGEDLDDELYGKS